MGVEVVAVRYVCDFGCDLSAICGDGALPDGWYEMPPPPWRATSPARYACPDHAQEVRDLHRRQWARYQGRTYVVSAEEYELVKAGFAKVAHELDRLRFSGERADRREV